MAQTGSSLSDKHFASTFFDAQQKTVNKSLPGRLYIPCSSTDSSITTHRLHLRNIAPNIPHPIQRNTNDSSGSLNSIKNIRRVQSEFALSKKKSQKSSFHSIKRALSPFLFKSKKKISIQEEDEEVGNSTARQHVIMETGFPASPTSNLLHREKHFLHSLSEPAPHSPKVSNLYPSKGVASNELKGVPTTLERNKDLSASPHLERRKRPIIKRRPEGQSSTPSQSLDRVKQKLDQQHVHIPSRKPFEKSLQKSYYNNNLNGDFVPLTPGLTRARETTIRPIAVNSVRSPRLKSTRDTSSRNLNSSYGTSQHKAIHRIDLTAQNTSTETDSTNESMEASTINLSSEAASINISMEREGLVVSMESGNITKNAVKKRVVTPYHLDKDPAR